MLNVSLEGSIDSDVGIEAMTTLIGADIGDYTWNRIVQASSWPRSWRIAAPGRRHFSRTIYVTRQTVLASPDIM